MVSSKELQVIESYIQRAVRSKVMAVDFTKVRNGGRLCLIVTTSKLKLVANFVYLLINCFMVIHSGHRLYRIFVQRSYTAALSLQVIYMFMWICPIFILSLNAGFGLQRQALVPLYNELIRLHGRIGSKAATKREKYLNFLHKGFTLTAAVGTIAIAGTELQYAWNVYANSYCCGCGMLVSITWTLMLVFMLYCAYTIFGLVQMLLFLYFALVHDALKHNDGDPNDDEKVTTQETISNYRALSIVCTIFNATFCKTLIPSIKYLPALLIMTCFNAAIRLKSIDPMSLTIRLALFIIGVYLWVALIVGANMTSALWVVSKDFIWNFQAREGNKGKYVTRVSRSFTPLRFGVAGLYYMEKHAKLTLMNFIVTGIVNLLLAFKD